MTSFSVLLLAASFSAFFSSAFALSFGKPFDFGFGLSPLMTRYILYILGIVILGVAAYMYLTCPCCLAKKEMKKVGASKSNKSKSMKKHTDRAASVDSKRNSSTSSVRKSPRKATN